MLKKLLPYLLILICFNSISAQLPIDGPERRQLLAMGYEIEKEDATDEFTIASSGGGKIVFSKNNERLVFARFFNRDRKLSASEEHALLKIINELNREYSFQFSVSEGSVNVSLYDFGKYDARNFAKLMRLMEQVNTAFDSQPELRKLINK